MLQSSYSWASLLACTELARRLKQALLKQNTAKYSFITRQAGNLNMSLFISPNTVHLTDVNIIIYKYLIDGHLPATLCFNNYFFLDEPFSKEIV